MNYLKSRLLIWRVNRAVKKGDVFKVCRLLGVTVLDKTEKQLIKALEFAYKELMDTLVTGERYEA